MGTEISNANKTAGVVLDKWKLPVFKKRLDEAGFSYTEQPGITPDTATLSVKYEWVADLQPIIQQANDECAKNGPPKN